MRYAKNQTITISEDVSTRPKSIRFEETDQETVDTNAFDELKTGDISLPKTVTFEIPLGAIGQASYLYLKADQELNLSLDDGPNLTLVTNKPFEGWIKFSKIEVTTGDTETRISYAIGGA